MVDVIVLVVWDWYREKYGNENDVKSSIWLYGLSVMDIHGIKGKKGGVWDN